MSLLTLPGELILHICEHIDDAPTLQSLARACKALQSMAEIYLYSSVMFIKRSRADSLVEAIARSPHRSAYVRDLELRYSTTNYDFLSTPPLDLCSLSNLRSFVLESPFCNSHSRWIDHGDETWLAEKQACVRAFGQSSLLNPSIQDERPLRNLTSLTLHWTADKRSRFWEATPSFPVFLLPTLQSLELSCVEITEPDTESDLQRFERQTNLKSLTFIRSFVSPSALIQILSLPRALHTFTFHEIPHHTYSKPFSHSMVDDIGTFNRALAQQSESLVSLHIRRRDVEFGHSQSPILLKLSDFNSLTHLRLGPFNSDNFHNRDEYQGRNLGLDQPLPPRLTKLCLDEVSVGLLLEAGRTARLNRIFSAIKADELLENIRIQAVPLELDIQFSPYTLSYANDGLAMLRSFARHFEEMLLEQHPSLRTPKCGHDEPDVLTGPSSNPTTDSSSSRSPSVHFRVLKAESVAYVPPYLYTEQSPQWVTQYDSWLPSGRVVDERDSLSNSESNEAMDDFP